MHNALTNIEPYEALKKDLSEDSARMIAEVVPPAGDLSTKVDVAEIRGDIGRLEVRIAEEGRRLDRRFATTEVRLILLLVVPLWSSAVAVVGKYVFG